MNPIIEKQNRDPAAESNGSLTQWVNRYFILLLVGAYLCAVIAPSFGLWIRQTSLGQVPFLEKDISLSLLMLAFLLFNAGFGLDRAHFVRLSRRPGVLLAGLATNFCVPLAFILILSLVAGFLPVPGLTSNLAGLALVAAMPIANSSTAWSQNANANMALCLGLVFCSTFLAPLTTPLALYTVGNFLDGGLHDALSQLARSFSGYFVFLWVILPAALGMAAQRVTGDERFHKIKPHIKLANALNLLLLNYTHASGFLPRVLAEYDFTYLANTMAVAFAFCVGTMLLGWTLGGLLKTDLPERIALMFGLGMKNNGVALILASFFMGNYPMVGLTIVFCTLGQHLVAGGSFFLFNSRAKELDTKRVFQQQRKPGKHPATALQSGIKR